MRYKIKNILLKTWGLFTTTSVTWEKIAAEDLTVNEIRKNFVYPWIIFCVLVAEIFDSLYAFGKHIETGILNAIITSISLLGGYFLTKRISSWYLQKHLTQRIPENANETLVGYSFVCVYALKVITTILPGLFFLQILNVFIAYLVWEGCSAILKLNEEDRGNIVLILTLIIIFIPFLISRIILLMLPNA